MEMGLNIGFVCCVFILSVLGLVCADVTGGTEEFCLGDIMDLRCRAEEVIVIDKAIYGRGSCSRHQPDQDCNTDVTLQVDPWCTGRQGCRRPIDTGFEHDCDLRRGQILSLHITYSCHKVTPIARSDCKLPLSAPSTSGTLLLSLLVTDSCAQSYSPLILQAESGQTFNFTLIDPSVATNPSNAPCPTEVGYVKDLANGKNVEICGGKQRETQLILSNGNRLELIINRGITARMLFQYQVLGCADLDSIPGSRMRREDDKVTVECEESGKQWQLTCEHNAWQGDQGDCDKGGANIQHLKDSGNNESPISRDILVIVVGIVTLVASAAIVCVGIKQLVEEKNKKCTMNEEHIKTHF